MLQANINKERSTDRVLVLEPMENATGTTGLVDPRLFKGGNNLHAIMNPTNCMWHLQYDSGILPAPLKQKFTNFKTLLNFTEGYFKRRNIKIKEIRD